MAKITTPESLYGNSRDILREAERENEILADIAGETYESPGNIPNGKYIIEKRLLDAAQKKNELLESIADGGGAGVGANKLAIDYGTDVLSLKKGDTPIANSGVTLPAYGLNYDTATGGLTLTKNGTAVQGQTVSLPDYGSPLTASSTAGMTDTSKVYVNTTDGKWYYYDGSAWTEGGTYNSQGIDTDTTLLVSGAPADAKATGDAVSDLKESLILLTDEEDAAIVTQTIVNEDVNGVTVNAESENTISLYGQPSYARHYLFLNGQDATRTSSAAFNKTLDAGIYEINFSATGFTQDVQINYTETVFGTQERTPLTNGVVTFEHDVMIGIWMPKIGRAHV